MVLRFSVAFLSSSSSPDADDTLGGGISIVGASVCYAADSVSDNDLVVTAGVS